MRLLRRVAFGCVDSLPRWKLQLPAGLNLSGEYPIRTDETVTLPPFAGFTARCDNPLRQLPKRHGPVKEP